MIDLTQRCAPHPPHGFGAFFCPPAGNESWAKNPKRSVRFQHSRMLSRSDTFSFDSDHTPLPSSPAASCSACRFSRLAQKPSQLTVRDPPCRQVPEPRRGALDGTQGGRPRRREHQRAEQLRTLPRSAPCPRSLAARALSPLLSALPSPSRATCPPFADPGDPPSCWQVCTGLPGDATAPIGRIWRRSLLTARRAVPVRCRSAARGSKPLGFECSRLCRGPTGLVGWAASAAPIATPFGQGAAYGDRSGASVGTCA